MTYNNNTAILFLVFNRPDNTARVFNAIREAQPARLYVAADGARNEAEKAVCNEVRAIIKIDWDCELTTLYREHNLGCKLAVSSAITWFFEKEEMGIILEDDCLPSRSFFSFCSEMLERYKDDERIMHINGSNFQDGVRGSSSYYFSRMVCVWGWAGFRRVWEKYDLEMKTYPEFKRLNKIDKLPSYSKFKDYWIRSLDWTYEGKINTWDYQYGYLIFSVGGLTIVPNVNLISNIGVGADSTHTDTHPFANWPAFELNTLIHPRSIKANTAADIYAQSKEYPTLKAVPLVYRALRKIKRKFRSFLIK